MNSIPEEATGRPLRKDAERNRRRILDAAGTLFAEQGLGVSLDEIAHHADVGVGTVYRRFPDKQTLIDALFEDQLDTIAGVAEEALAIDDAWEGLEHFFRVALEKQAHNRGLKELLLGAGISESGGCGPRGRDRIEPLVVRLVERAHDAGALRPDASPYDVPLVQLMVSAVADYTRDVDPEVWRRLLTVVLDGLRAEGHAHSPMPVPPLDRDGVLRAMSGWRPPRG
ncbi:TetR/AcrR family transcriptional regulator [Patulibacter americanus]|uniref:TetR/AcrR family transcriptional regulator n=1 Tax=Patulibacter americanus TaxID=588672 RepID=UPI0003B63A3C|nr:TetR/AcrR family transcriptional regulator [Patulibacter americanus]